MALPLAPHLVGLWSATQNKGADKRNDVPTYTLANNVRGMISAADPTEAFSTWGVQSTRPAELLLALSDGLGIKPMDRVSWGMRVFVVKAPIRISQHGLPTDHVKVLLEEVGA